MSRFLVELNSWVHCRRASPLKAPAGEGSALSAPVAVSETHAARLVLELLVQFLFYLVNDLLPFRSRLYGVHLEHSTLSYPTVKCNLALRIVNYPCKLVDPSVHLSEVILVKILIEKIVVVGCVWKVNIDSIQFAQ